MKVKTVSCQHEICSPRPAAMISSLRAIGYDLPMAIADLMDNSIYAGATEIRLDYDWNEGDPWFRVTDNGTGMTGDLLHEAMRLGSQSPLDVRDKTDLGRFGLGLKTASFSQCRLLTVRTKTLSDQCHTRSWDLDHVCNTGQWEIGLEAPSDAEQPLSVLENMSHGTVVLCQKPDRLLRSQLDDEQDARDAFFAEFARVAAYLKMVFHRFLTGRNRITIFVGQENCTPWDPFLEKNDFTQTLSTEYLDDEQVVVKPFILPHVSKRTSDETAEGGGIRGWNAQQGFYVYRNRRMIIPGGYLDLPFKPEEHYKLCRILVDLPNDLDHEWGIDVRKAVASPPPRIRRDLERIAKAARNQAMEVYRARAGRPRRTTGPRRTDAVWLTTKRDGKVLYRINRENEAISRLLHEHDLPRSWIGKLFHLIERTVPHRQIILDNAENEDCQVNLSPEISPPPKGLVELCMKIFRERTGKGQDPDQAADYACSFFDDHPAYRAALDKLIEEKK